MRNNLLLFLLICLSVNSYSQPKTLAMHYGSDSGLSQNSITSIVQDKKGVLWFSTWDGINRFDGNLFKSFKRAKGNHIYLTNNHIKDMKVDTYGYIWLLTRDLRAHRFDPQTESAHQVPLQGSGTELNIESIELFPNGDTWLITEDHGAMRVHTTPDNHILSTQTYLPRQKVNLIRQDEGSNTWLLTNNGIACIRAGEDTPVSYLLESGRSFHSFLERSDEILFGTNIGEVVRFQKKSKQLTFLKLPVRGKIIALDHAPENKLLITSESKGFIVYNPDTGEMKRFSRENCPQYPVNRILSTYIYKGKEAWFEVEKVGVVCFFDFRTQQLTYQLIKTENGTTARLCPITEDIQGNEWVYPYGGGLSLFDRKSHRFVPFYNQPNAPNQKYSNKLHSMFFDSQGNLWFSSHSKGLEKITFLETKFFTAKTLPRSNSRTLDNDVRSIYEDTDHQLWVGFKNEYIRLFDSKLNEIGYLTKEGIITQSGSPLQVQAYSFIQDKENNLWIATKGEGVLRLKKQGNSYSITQFKHDPANIYSLSHNDAYHLYQDSHNRIWVATFGGGLNFIDPADSQQKFINFRNELKAYPIRQCPQTRQVTSDKKGNIWVGTTNGAVYFSENFQDAEAIEFHHIPGNPMEEDALSSNDVHWIYATAAKDLYLATFGGGLNRLTSMDKTGSPHFKSYTTKNGLTSDIIYTIQEDKKGNLWLSTEDRLSKFIPQEEMFENYNDNNFGFRLRFKEGACSTMHTGQFVFGSNHGIFYFHPDSIHRSSYTPPIVFSGLSLFNKPVQVGENSPLKKCLDATNKLVLTHKENNFTLQYAALDYRNAEGIQYAYYLKGFDKGWQVVGKQHTASYNNLPKGSYTFMVKSTNGDGIWVDNVRELQIEVLPAFWETSMAYTLYIIGALLIILLLAHIRFTMYRLKNKVRIEQQITNIKLRFFTDISHEFRTPLTLISAPLEYVLHNVALPEEGKKHLAVVKRNTDRMLSLINQILDFRKIQNNKMRLVIQDIRLTDFLGRIMDNFNGMAQEKQIEFRMEAPDKELHLWADVDKLNKIIFNLLSNAFKFTPSHKKVNIIVKEDTDHLIIEVKDEGIGISQDKINFIFDRFESWTERASGNPVNSSGIGLSLVKKLMNLHQGSIEAQSILGKGSTFTLTFLKGRSHYDEQTEFIVGDTEIKEYKSEESLMLPDNTENEVSIPSEPKKLLIVEDNEDLRSFLKDIFAKDYMPFEADNGQEGFEKAIEIQPDMIISDIMMPVKNGIELMKDIRDSIETSHIPVILLTAKSDIESKLEGLEYGADDYITKPFNTTYLKARVANILRTRQKLSQLYCYGQSESTANSEQPTIEEETTMTAFDHHFMDKLTQLIEIHLDNGELTVDDLVKEFPMGRSTFNNKVKALTGMAPVKFVQEIRLNKAGELIRKGELSIAQIAYAVGFNSSHYFNRIFKQKFGMSPTEYSQS